MYFKGFYILFSSLKIFVVASLLSNINTQDNVSQWVSSIVTLLTLISGECYQKTVTSTTLMTFTLPCIPCLFWLINNRILQSLQKMFLISVSWWTIVVDERGKSCYLISHLFWRVAGVTGLYVEQCCLCLVPNHWLHCWYWPGTTAWTMTLRQACDHWLSSLL